MKEGFSDMDTQQNTPVHQHLWNRDFGLLVIADLFVAMGVYMQVNGKYQAMPVISKVRNNGFDGTGLYCKAVKPSRFGKKTSDTYDYNRQPIDRKKTFTLRYDGGRSRNTSFQILDRFINPGPGMIMKSHINLTAYRILCKRKLRFLRIYHQFFRK